MPVSIPIKLLDKGSGAKEVSDISDRVLWHIYSVRSRSHS